MYQLGIGGWPARRRLRDPDKPALICGDEVLTYGALADGVERLAAALSHRGIGPGDAVAYVGENSPVLLQSLFAVTRLGAAFVPVNTRLATVEIEHVLTDSGARIVLHDARLTDRVAPAARAVAADRILSDDDGEDGSRPGLRAIAATGPAGTVPDPAPVTHDDPAVVMYTSGTTGKAKGAVLTHGNLTWVSVNCVVDYDVVSTDVLLLTSPLFHAAALGMGALPVILKGGTIVLERGFDAGRALDLIERHRVTMLSGVPTTYQLMADHPAWPRTDLSTLEKLTCGGSAVPTRILDAYEARGLAFSQGYGMTETSPGATSLAPDRTRDKRGSVGLPHFFMDVRISDGAGGTAPPGVVGEIEIAGPNVFPGYLGLPAATAAAFTGDGWYRSGDLGYQDQDGYLYVADRLKDMIISGGENIYPAEVEDLVAGIDGVTGVAVIGVPDERWGEVPWAVVTVHDDAELTTEQVRTLLDGRIARYKLPQRVVVVDDIPRTASGKARKADLRARFTGN
ncbi:long-chain fatty acid--CoA ligase [Myceligenerans halotolerans]